MSWYKWLQSFSTDKEVIRTKNMLIHSIIPFVDTKIDGYKIIKPNLLYFVK